MTKDAGPGPPPTGGEPDAAAAAGPDLPPAPEVPDDLAAYALGALDPLDRRQLEAYLGAAGDPRLTQRLAEYRVVADLLPHAVAPQALPPASWDAVLTRVRHAQRPGPRAAWSRTVERARQSWRLRRRGLRRGLSTVAWPALATACVVLLLWNVQLQRNAPGLSDMAGVAGVAGGGSAVGAQQLARLPQGPIVPLEGTGRPGASARLFVEREGRSAWLAVAGLPPLPGDRVYQLWFARPGQTPVSGATFRVDAEGGAVAPVLVPAPLGEVNAVAVTEEAAPGSPRPTGAHLLDGRP